MIEINIGPQELSVYNMGYATLIVLQKRLSETETLNQLKNIQRLQKALEVKENTRDDCDCSLQKQIIKAMDAVYKDFILEKFPQSKITAILNSAQTNEDHELSYNGTGVWDKAYALLMELERYIEEESTCYASVFSVYNVAKRTLQLAESTRPYLPPERLESLKNIESALQEINDKMVTKGDFSFDINNQLQSNLADRIGMAYINLLIHQPGMIFSCFRKTKLNANNELVYDVSCLSTRYNLLRLFMQLESPIFQRYSSCYIAIEGKTYLEQFDKISVYEMGRYIARLANICLAYPETLMQHKSIENLTNMVQDQIPNDPIQANMCQTAIIKAMRDIFKAFIKSNPDTSIFDNANKDEDGKLFYDMSVPATRDTIYKLVSKLENKAKQKNFSQKPENSLEQLSVYMLASYSLGKLIKNENQLEAKAQNHIRTLLKILSSVEDEGGFQPQGNAQDFMISLVSAIYLSCIGTIPNVSVFKKVTKNDYQELVYDLGDQNIKDQIFLLMAKLDDISDGKKVNKATSLPIIQGIALDEDLVNKKPFGVGITFINKNQTKEFSSKKNGLGLWDDVYNHTKKYAQNELALFTLYAPIKQLLEGYSNVRLLEELTSADPNSGCAVFAYIECDDDGHLHLNDVTNSFSFEIFTQNGLQHICYKDRYNSINLLTQPFEEPTHEITEKRAKQISNIFFPEETKKAV